MNDFNFKVGDLVYCPMATNEVLKVTPSLNIRYKDTTGYICRISVYDNGKWTDTHHNPAIFPATQEWYDKLVRAYPNLEKPPKRKTPKEIIQAMLDDGKAGVVCYVSDKDSQPLRSINKELITVIDNNAEHMFCSYSNCFRYAAPFDLDTGKIIVDYVNGEVVLED